MDVDRVQRVNKQSPLCLSEAPGCSLFPRCPPFLPVVLAARRIDGASRSLPTRAVDRQRRSSRRKSRVHRLCRRASRTDRSCRVKLTLFFPPFLCSWPKKGLFPVLDPIPPREMKETRTHIEKSRGSLNRRTVCGTHLELQYSHHKTSHCAKTAMFCAMCIPRECIFH